MRARTRSKSPYDGIKSKIVNRSVTVGKNDGRLKKSNVYL